VAIRGSWARVFVDPERCLVYGPALGRLYLLSASHALEGPMQRVLGLHGFALDDELPDPAERIVHDRSSLNAVEPVAAPRSLRSLYRLLHYSRHLVPFRLAAAGVEFLARRSPARPAGEVADIGRQVHAVERATGIADCYPRALLTCYLCLRNGRGCELAIGTLAPTRKMHAWCSTAGQLPYEAMPEHYLYRPLLVLPLSP
jgi:hypothetical protein